MTSARAQQPEPAFDVGGRFAKAFAGRDAVTIGTLLTDDAVLHSPITGQFQVEGREAVLHVLRILMGNLEDPAFATPLESKGQIALPFSTRVKSRPINVFLIFEMTSDGLIRDIQGFVRPLPSVAAFAAAIAPLVARPGGRAASTVLALLFGSLASIVRGGERLAVPLVAGGVQAATSDPNSIRFTRY